MVSATITLSTALARFTNGEKQFTVPPGTFADVMDHVHTRHPLLRDRLTDSGARPLPFINIFINGENVRHEFDPDLVVDPGAEVLIMSAVAGG